MIKPHTEKALTGVGEWVSDYENEGQSKAPLWALLLKICLLMKTLRKILLRKVMPVIFVLQYLEWILFFSCPSNIIRCSPTPVRHISTREGHHNKLQFPLHRCCCHHFSLRGDKLVRKARVADPDQISQEKNRIWIRPSKTAGPDWN